MRSKRLYVGGVALLVVVTTLSGCSMLGGGGCGPGDAEIGSIEASGTGTVTVTGSVTQTGPGSFAIDDGTGTAFVMSGQSDVAGGDCVTVTGVPTPTFSSQQADVAIATTNVSVA